MYAHSPVHCIIPLNITAASGDTSAVDPSPVELAAALMEEEGLQVRSGCGGDRGGSNSLNLPVAASLGDAMRSADDSACSSTDASVGHTRSSRRVNAQTRSKTTTRGKFGRMLAEDCKQGLVSPITLLPSDAHTANRRSRAHEHALKLGFHTEGHIIQLEDGAKEKLDITKFVPELAPYLHEGRLDWARCARE